MPISYRINETIEPYIPETALGSTAEPIVRQITNYVPDYENSDQIQSITSWARTADKIYNLYRADPFSHFAGKEKEIVVPGQPTIEKIPDRAKELAEMVKIVHEYENIDRRGLADPQKVIDDRMKLTGLADKYTIDPSLSNTEAITFVNKNTGEAVVAFRGTETKHKIKSGISKGKTESTIWLEIGATGSEGRYDQFIEAEQLVSRAKAKYPNLELAGYSMGGTKALRAGDTYGIKANVFNPFLGINAMFGKRMHPDLVHDVYATSGDIASSLLGISKPKNMNVEIIEPLKTLQSEYIRFKFGKKVPVKLEGFIGPLKHHHSLSHFTEEGERVSFQPRAIQEIGIKDNEAVIRDIANKAIRDGKTYAEFIHDVNYPRSGDTRVVGDRIVLDSNRVGKGSNFYEIFIEEGGSLNSQEERYVENIRPVEKFISSLTPAEKQRIRNGETEQFREENVSRNIDLENPEHMKYTREQLSRAMKAVGIIQHGTGLATGMLGSAIAQKLEHPLHLDELHPEIRTAIEGGLGGGLAEIAQRPVSAAITGYGTVASRISNQGVKRTVQDAGEAIVGMAMARQLPKMANALKSIRQASVAGAIGFTAQELVTNHLNNAFQSAGMDEGAANITANTIGGGVGGAATVAAIPALNAAYAAGARALGTVAVEETTALLGAEALTETALAAAETTGALAAAEGGLNPIADAMFVGSLIGAGIAGGFALFEETQRKRPEPSVIRLLPFQNPDADRAIGNNQEVIRIMEEFNRNGDFSEEAQTELTNHLNEVIGNMNIWQGSYNYPVRLQRVPLNSQVNQSNTNPKTSVMIAGDYSNIVQPEEWRQVEDEARDAMIAYRNSLAPVHQHGTLVLRTIANDPRVQTARNINEMNEIIRYIIQEQQDSHHQFREILMGIEKLPQIDANGNLIFMDYSNPNPVPPQDSTTVQPVQVPQGHPAEPDAYLRHFITNDPKARSFATDRISLNKTILEHFMKNPDELYAGDTVPQFNASGTQIQVPIKELTEPVVEPQSSPSPQKV